MTVDEAMQIAQKQHVAGRLGEAETLYRQVLGVVPNHPGALHLLGVIAGQQGRHELAVELIGQSLAGDQGNAGAYNDLSVFLNELGRFEGAMAAAQRAIALAPGYAAAHSNLAIALFEQRQFQAAEASARKAIELSPKYSDAYINLAGALRAQRKYDDSIDLLRTAICLNPDHTEAHWNVVWLLLLTGRFEEGWKEQEFHSRLGKPATGSARMWTQPRWNGTELGGKTILLFSEQGFGDTIQFVRYVPMVAARGGQVILECQPGLVRLLSEYPGTEKVLAYGDSLPPFDVRLPLTSLAAIFDSNLHSIPQMPPLRPPANLVETWQTRVGPRDGRVRRLGLEKWLDIEGTSPTKHPA